MRGLGILRIAADHEFSLVAEGREPIVTGIRLIPPRIRFTRRENLPLVCVRLPDLSGESERLLLIANIAVRYFAQTGMIWVTSVKNVGAG